MIKKVGFIFTILLLGLVILWSKEQKPKIVSSITTMDRAYLTILVDKRDTKNLEKLEEKILKMCREDSFEEIKLQTDDKPMAKKLHIFVYSSKKDLEKGVNFLTIKNEAGD